MDLPIVCKLSETDLQERRRTILEFFQQGVLAITPVADGYIYSFTPTSEVLAQLARLVDLERQCCQFLTFRIVVEPGQPIKLEVVGPPGSQEVIADFLHSAKGI